MKIKNDDQKEDASKHPSDLFPVRQYLFPMKFRKKKKQKNAKKEENRKRERERETERKRRR